MTVERVLTTEDGLRLLTEDDQYLQADGYESQAQRPARPQALAYDRQTGTLSCGDVEHAAEYVFYAGDGPQAERTAIATEVSPSTDAGPLGDEGFKTFQVRASDDYTGLESLPSEVIRVAGPRRKHPRS